VTFLTPPPIVATASRPRRWMDVLAALVVIAAVIAALVLWRGAAARYDDNVDAFARAPVGCDTTLDFDRAGEFVIYLETTGNVDGLGGDCDPAVDYARASDGLPQPALRLRSAEGRDVELSSTAGVDYDTGSFVGTPYRLADVPATGSYVLTVDDETDEPYAVAVGGDPGDGVAVLRWSAAAVLVAGLAVGLVLVALARRRRSDPFSPDALWADTAWAPTATSGPQYAGWPQGPPGLTVEPPPSGGAPPASWGPPTAQ
jgi:hypothetical protein